MGTIATRLSDVSGSICERRKSRSCVFPRIIRSSLQRRSLSVKSCSSATWYGSTSVVKLLHTLYSSSGFYPHKSGIKIGRKFPPHFLAQVPPLLDSSFPPLHFGLFPFSKKSSVKGVIGILERSKNRGISLKCRLPSKK